MLVEADVARELAAAHPHARDQRLRRLEIDVKEPQRRSNSIILLVVASSASWVTSKQYLVVPSWASWVGHVATVAFHKDMAAPLVDVQQAETRTDTAMHLVV